MTCLGGAVYKGEAPDAAALAVCDPQLLPIRGEGEPRGLRPRRALAAAVGIFFATVAAECLSDARCDVVPPNLVLAGHCDIQAFILHPSNESVPQPIAQPHCRALF